MATKNLLHGCVLALRAYLQVKLSDWSYLQRGQNKAVGHRKVAIHWQGGNKISWAPFVVRPGPGAPNAFPKIARDAYWFSLVFFQEVLVGRILKKPSD